MRIWNILKCRIVYTTEKQNRQETIMYYFFCELKNCVHSYFIFFPNEYIIFITNDVQVIHEVIDTRVSV